MEINDKVWFTGSAQWLHDHGFGESESTFLLHTYGTIIGTIDDTLLVSFAEFCNYEEGYSPVAVWLDKKHFKLAVFDVTEDCYI